MLEHNEVLDIVTKAIAAGEPARAYSLYQDDSAVFGWQLPERELLQIISGLHNRKLWSESVGAMAEYVGNFSERQTQVRLKLAQILVQVEHRPRQALNVLEKLHEPLLPKKQAALLRQLKAAAEATRDENPLEVVEDW